VKFITHPQVLLIIAGIACKMLAAFVLWRRGLLLEYAGLGLYLAGGASCSAYLVTRGTLSPTGYHDAWIATRWVPVLLISILVVDCHYLMAKHFRNVAVFAAGMLLAFAVLSALATWSVSPIGLADWIEAVVAPLKVVRNHAFFSAALLGLCRWWWFSSPSTRLKPNVYLLVNVTLAMLVYEWLCLLAMRSFGRTSEWPNYFLAVVPFATSLAWSRMSTAGERWDPPTPLPPGASAAAERELRAIGKSMRRAAGE